MSKRRKLSMMGYSEGGTLIINIQINRLPLYKAAEELHGDPNIVIHDKSTKCAYSSTHSLHLLCDPYRDSANLFWQTFCMVEDEMLNTARHKAAVYIANKALERIMYKCSKI
jgi:hypothetical protein